MHNIHIKDFKNVFRFDYLNINLVLYNILFLFHFFIIAPGFIAWYFIFWLFFKYKCFILDQFQLNYYKSVISSA